MRSLFGAELQSGQVQFTEVQLAQFVTSVCESWQRQRPEVAVRLDFCPGAERITSQLPSHTLARSLMDLLNNAVEASSGPPVAIDVAIVTANDGVAIEVRDRGRGVSEAVRGRLGQPFVSSRSDGTGLGLYTARAVVEALGGTLVVSDRNHGGTTVRLNLPAVRGAVL